MMPASLYIMKERIRSCVVRLFEKEERKQSKVNSKCHFNADWCDRKTGILGGHWSGILLQPWAPGTLRNIIL